MRIEADGSQFHECPCSAESAYYLVRSHFFAPQLDAPLATMSTKQLKAHTCKSGRLPTEKDSNMAHFDDIGFLLMDVAKMCNVDAARILTGDANRSKFGFA